MLKEALEIFHEDTQSDIDIVGRQLVSEPHQLAAALAHHHGIQFAVAHIAEFQEFIDRFGGLLPLDEDWSVENTENESVEATEGGGHDSEDHY